MRIQPALLVAIALTGLLSTLASSAFSAAVPSFTEQQAAAGKLAYDEACLPCHRPTGGAGVIPVLVGDSFKTRWADRSLLDLFAAVERMPPGIQLDGDSYANITAYLLDVHGITPGEAPLPSTSEALASMVFPTTESSVPTHGSRRC